MSHWYGIQTHKQLTKHMCWSFGLSRRAALKCGAVRLSKADLGRDKSEAATRLTKAWRDSTCCWCCWYVATTHRNQDIHGCTCLQYAAKEGQARGTAGTSWHCLIRHLDESDKDSFIKFYQSWNQQDKRSYGDHHSPFFKIHPSKLKTFFCWPSWPSTFYILLFQPESFILAFSLCVTGHLEICRALLKSPALDLVTWQKQG